MIVLLVLCKMGKPSLLGVAWCHSGGADVSDATPRNQDPSASDVASAWWSRVWRVWCQQSSVTWRHSGVGGAGVDWCRANTLKLDGARHIRGATGCCSCILEVFWGGHPGGIPYRSRGGVKNFLCPVSGWSFPFTLLDTFCLPHHNSCYTTRRTVFEFEILFRPI